MQHVWHKALYLPVFLFISIRLYYHWISFWDWEIFLLIAEDERRLRATPNSSKYFLNILWICVDVFLFSQYPYVLNTHTTNSTLVKYYLHILQSLWALLPCHSSLGLSLYHRLPKTVFLHHRSVVLVPALLEFAPADFLEFWPLFHWLCQSLEDLLCGAGIRILYGEPPSAAMTKAGSSH